MRLVVNSEVVLCLCNKWIIAVSNWKYYKRTGYTQLHIYHVTIFSIFHTGHFINQNINI